MNMTLEQVRDWHRFQWSLNEARGTPWDGKEHEEMADAIDAHLSRQFDGVSETEAFNAFRTAYYGANKSLAPDLEAFRRGFAALTAIWHNRPAQDQHPDDIAVDAFADAMKAKLAEARRKGRSGWQDKTDCPQQRLSNMLRDHVEKGDPRDVANFCMFLHQRGEAILPAQERSDLMSILHRIGHIHLPDARCRARVKATPRHLLPPGAAEVPIFCCLKDGHEGPHRFNHGGMHSSIPFRDTYEVEYREPSCGTCAKCGEAWPCDTAKVIHGLAAAPEASSHG